MGHVTTEMVAGLLGLASAVEDIAVEVVETEQADDHQRLRVAITCPDGDVMPAFLLVPTAATNAPGVVVFHQHASQWHLGKSEVCGLAGNPTNAFGPALVDAGLVVLAPDAVGFEDRRRTTPGTDPHPDDAATSGAAATYRARLANEVGTERASIIPGVLDVFDIDDLTSLIAPRPLVIFAGTEDRYALDAAAIGEVTRHAYRRADAADQLHVSITPGSHALTDERSQAIVQWVIDTAHSG